MKLNRKKKPSLKIKEYGLFPTYAHYKSINNLNRNIEVRLDRESEMYEVTSDTNDVLTGEVFDIDELHDFLEKHGFLIRLACSFD